MFSRVSLEIDISVSLLLLLLVSLSLFASSRRSSLSVTSSVLRAFASPLTQVRFVNVLENAHARLSKIPIAAPIGSRDPHEATTRKKDSYHVHGSIRDEWIIGRLSSTTDRSTDSR